MLLTAFRLPRCHPTPPNTCCVLQTTQSRQCTRCAAGRQQQLRCMRLFLAARCVSVLTAVCLLCGTQTAPGGRKSSPYARPGG